MKFVGIKIKKGYLMLFVTLFLLALSCILITSGIYQKGQNEKLSRGYYTENAQSVSVTDIKDNAVFQRTFSAEQFAKTVVYKTDLVSGMDCRGVAYSEKKNVFPIRSGRCFSAKESVSDKRIAVIGNSVLEKTIEKENKRYLQIADKEYEVIGITGKRSSSRLDSVVLLPMGAAFELSGTEGKYIVDGDNEKEVTDVYEKVLEKWSDNAEIVLNVSAYREEKSVGDVMEDGTNRILLMVYAAVVISFFLTAAACSIYWFRYRKAYMKAMKILGFSDMLIFRKIFVCYLKAAVPALLLSFMVTVFLWLRKVILEIRMTDFCVSFIITIVISSIFVAASVFLFQKKTTERAGLGNVTLDVVIGLQFAIFFWLFIQIAGYYVDLNSDSWIQVCKGNYSYFTIFLNSAESSNEKYLQLEDDPLYHVHVQNALKRVREQEEFSYMSYAKDWVIYMDMETIEKHFGEDNYDDFLRGSLYPGYYDIAPAVLKPQPQELDGVNQIQMSFCSMDYNAVKHYNLKTAQGEMFAASDYSVSQITTEFPVVLGAAYAPYFSVGDEFTMYVYGKPCLGKIIGILEEDTKIISDLTEEENSYPTVLDYDIIFPFMNFEEIPQDEDLKSFAFENDFRQLLGILVMEGKADAFEKVELQKIVNDIYREEDLFTVTTMAATQGVYLFQNETRQAMAVLTTLICVVLSFNLFSLCISLINKIDRKMRRYSIQLMNGCTMAKIFRGYFWEILCVTLCGFLIAVGIQRELVLYNLKYIYVMCGIWLILLLLSGSIVWKKLSTVNMEMLMRRKE